jgi:DNA-binding response OmpR family regulator
MTLAPKIIVADDDQALSRTLSWILKDNGYEVVTVPGGENLIEHLLADQYDLLLLDIMMPKVDGLQLLERVKTDYRFKDLPVLMISSMPPEEATVRSLGLGAADFISKPFRVRELLARVKAHLRTGRELNQARAEARSRTEMVDILQEVTATLKPDEIYQILVRRVARGLRISKCSILIGTTEDETGTVVAAYENPMLRNLRVDLRRYPEIQHALTTGEIVLSRMLTTRSTRPSARNGRRRGDGPHRLPRSRCRSRSGATRRACSSSGPRRRMRRSTSRTWSSPTR